MDRLIIDYLPSVLKDVREIQAITDTEQLEINSLWDAVSNTMDDQFISTATENGVSRWEKILNIVPKGTDNLQDRKFRILTRLNARLPYTFERLNELLTTLCGVGEYTMTLQNTTYTLIVRVALTSKNNFDDVEKLLKSVCPANLVINLSLLYNQHQTLAAYTHGQLAAYTHDQLRNEVLN